MYFIANWKMYGNLSSLNTLDSVIKFSKSKEIKKGRLIYCPPYTLINSFKNFSKKKIGGLLLIFVIIIAFGFGGFGGGFSTGNQNNIAR